MADCSFDADELYKNHHRGINLVAIAMVVVIRVDFTFTCVGLFQYQIINDQNSPSRPNEENALYYKRPNFIAQLLTIKKTGNFIMAEAIIKNLTKPVYCRVLR